MDDIELVVLNKLNTSENVNFDFPYEVYDRFNLDDMTKPSLLPNFVLRSDTDPSSVTDSLMKCNQRSVFTGMEGLCMLLKRLAYPCRYSDLIHRFGRPVPILGMITKEVIDYICNIHHHKITN